MRKLELIEQDYTKRLEQVLDEAWRIFKSQFINKRNEINKEAPFQHHFAQIIKGVGDLYSLNRNDLFKVDLESMQENVKEKKKYIDITCGFQNRAKCAIELKFKTKGQGAQDIGRMDAYVDIEALEIVTLDKNEYKFGKFYMITDLAAYTKPFKSECVGNFKFHHEHTIEPGEYIHNSTWKDRKSITVNLRNSYPIQWEKVKRDETDWFFLELKV